MNTYEYFAPGFSSFEEVEAAHGPFYDGSTLMKIATCPRLWQVSVEERLRHQGDGRPPLACGLAIHSALEYYYANPNRNDLVEETAKQIARDSWNAAAIERATMDPKYVHMSADFMADILTQYFNTWNYERIEIFQPMTDIHVEDLDLSNVLAAKFLQTDSGAVIIGESSLVMKFDVDGEPFILAGKPDLPVYDQSGNLWVMDHKTTSSYLSDWWAKTWEVSNKMRGYMAMVRDLLHRTPVGLVINGIHVGKNATNPTSKADKTHRYPFEFTPDHITEALRNQRSWVQTVDFYRKAGYFPQGCGYGGCSQPDLCRADPDDREEIKRQKYEENTRRFWDL